MTRAETKYLADVSRAAADALGRIAAALEKLAAQGEIQGMREARRDRAAGLHEAEGEA